MRDFVRYRREHLTGDEKGEGQIFLEHYSVDLADRACSPAPV